MVRRIEAKFRKPGKGAVTSSVSTPLQAIDDLKTELAAKGRALISVAVDLRDEAGVHTLAASVEWFIARGG